MTIRRDLEALEHEGALRRVHGGAISLASRGYAAPYSVRATRSAEAKERIGQAAAAMLGERETVILDVGTTTLQVARALHRPAQPHRAHPEPADRQPAGQATAASGSWSPAASVTAGELSLVGDLAEEAFSRLRFDTFVMGVGGIDVESGCTEFSLDDARVKRAALASVRRCIVVADSSQARQGHLRPGLPARARRRARHRQRRGTREAIAALEAEHVEVVVA